MSVVSGWATDVGYLREVNEDQAVVCRSVFAVADGMGGHAAGEVASRIVAQELALLDDRAELATTDLLTALNTANEAILQSVQLDSSRAGMGTTVAGIALVRVGGADHCAVFNIGDSRVYRLTAGGMARLTVDHSEVQRLIEAGELSEDSARHDARRNIVTRSLGTSPGPATDLWVFPPVGGDRFLICSDGLSSEVAENVIGDLLAARDEPGSVAQRLVDAALSVGGTDNVTAIVVDFTTELGERIDESTVPRGQLVIADAAGPPDD